MALAGAVLANKTLHFVAARQAQQDPLVLGFDPLHQHRPAEREPERHDGLGTYATVG
jgi:hypothetical protein